MSNLNLNILYFAPCGLHEGVGGSARLKDMVYVLQQMGVNIQLLPYIPKDKFKIEREKIGNLLSITKVYIPKSYPKFLKALAIPLIIINGLKYSRGSDIMFAHSPCVVSGFPAMILAKMFNKPLIIDHMDAKDPDTPQFVFSNVLKNSTVVFAISRYLEKEVKNKYNKNVKYIPIFTDTNVFQRDDSERKKIRKKLEIRDEDILIGYAGSFSHVEGVPLLFKAFKNLIKKYENIKLIVIGGRNVPNSDNISLLVDELSLKEKVILIPPQPHELIPKYLSACDILCSPKIDCAENRAANPVKVVEYLSMGLPTVCSAVGGIVDTIEDGTNGFLVKPGDVKDLKDTLEWIILNPERSKEIGESGRRTAIEKYSYDAIRDIIKQSIEEIIYRKKD